MENKDVRIDSEEQSTQTVFEPKECVCQKEGIKNELIMREDRMICILNRDICSTEEWDEVKETVQESDIGLEEMLEQYGKVMEGNKRVDQEENEVGK